MRLTEDGTVSWPAIGRLLARSSAPLPLLESWGCSFRQWHLISVAPTGLLPDATVTVYTEPPARLTDDAFARYVDLVRVGPCVALIESASGSLAFERVWDIDEVRSWRERAQGAARCGIYPGDPRRDPGALIGITASQHSSAPASTPGIKILTF